MTVLTAVADQGGFAPAARKLGMSPSAVTRAIAALEEHLGVRLLARTTRRVSLTDPGSRFLERARRILGDVAEAEAAAQRERATPSGRFTVAAPNMFGRLHVAPLMCAYLRRFPDVVGELTLSDRVVNLVEDGVDAAVRIGALDDSSLVARAVGATRRVLVAAPKYLKRRKTPRHPAELAGHEVIQFTALSPTREWRFLRAGREERVAIEPRYVTNSADAAIGHALLEAGVTMVLAYQVSDAVRTGKLRVVLAEYEPPPLPIHVVYPTSRLLSAKVRAFVDMAVKRDWRFVTL